ncbi:TetR/AcrR family transcriptional regulator [Streptomyces millisiae]|uniref:TetR family transcriptional regulator n=1 Tax=Streptomyces millisiae TaxID=3075542 RepID=A0ABU2LQ11_9ACTN|nr:TetR family transcriptional regulator [Streptomyces sp. DSM 44918]MDT0319684.1 TetR family transcriptional regulator [Streptomyces sp. DSM 44918]
MTPDADAPLGLRERKKRETRVALSRATIRLCVERGWENVTVEDIAAVANVSVRTFRNYFSGKAEAIAASHVERMLRIADELRARPATEPLWDAITGVVLAEFGGPAEPAGAESPQARRWRDGVRLMLAEPALQGEIVKANAAAQGAFAEAVAERIGSDPAHDVYPKLVAAVVGAASSVAVEHSLTAEPPTAVGPVLAEMLERLAVGLRAPS